MNLKRLVGFGLSLVMTFSSLNVGFAENVDNPVKMGVVQDEVVSDSAVGVLTDSELRNYQMKLQSLNNENIKIGDYIQMGRYLGEDILWRCVDIDENGPLMLSDKILCFKPFDAAGKDKSGSHKRGRCYVEGIIDYERTGYYRQLYGSNYWGDSNIRSWLNSASSEGNVNWECGNPPNESNVYNGYNEYDNEKGFLANFTDEELSYIKNVTQKSLLDEYEYDSIGHNNIRNVHRLGTSITTVLSNYNTAYSEDCTDRMFLLDVKQVYSVYSNLGDYYIAKPTKSAVDNNEYYIDDNINIDKSRGYWLRSMASLSESDSIRNVSRNGNINYTYAYNGTYGIRPAFYLDTSKLNFKIGNGSEDYPFIFNDGDIINDGRTIELNTNSLSMIMNDVSSTLKATVKKNGVEIVNPNDLTWESSDESIVKVNKINLTSQCEAAVTSIGLGNATITAKLSNGASASCLVSVNKTNEYNIKVYSNRPNLNIISGENITIGAGIYNNKDEQIKDISNMAITIEDISVLGITSTFKKDNCSFVNLIGKKTGTSAVDITDSNTGTVSRIYVTVSDRTGNTYTVFGVPKISVEDNIANFYNFNGLYIDSFNKTFNNDNSCNIKFDVYNKNYMYGIVEVFNSEGKLTSIQLINKNSDNATSIKGSVYDNTCCLIDDIANRNLLSYKQQSGFTKRTSIGINNVPINGYIKITTDPKQSGILSIINSIDLALSIKSVKDGIDGLSDKQQQEIIEKFSLKLLNSTLKNEIIKNPEKYSEKLYKSISKDILNKFIFNNVNAGNIASSLIATLSGTDEKEIENMLIGAMSDIGISVAEKVFVDLAGPAGEALKGIFTFAEIENATLEANSLCNSFDTGSIVIQVPDNNSRFNNEIKVENTKFDNNEISLDVYKVSTDNPLIKKIIEENLNIHNLDNADYYNISVLLNGEEVKLNSNTAVVINIPEDLLPYAHQLKVYRLEENGMLTDMKAEVSRGTLLFYTNHFSIYAVVNIGENLDNPTTSTPTTETPSETTTVYRRTGGGGGGSLRRTTTTNESTTEATTIETTEATTESVINSDVTVTIGSKKVIVGYKTYDIDAAPYIQTSSNSTMVPLRFVAIAILGDDFENADNSNIIDWNANTKTAIITVNNKGIEFIAGSDKMVIDGIPTTMENGVSAEIKDGRMYIPFRALGSALGVKVDWIADTKTTVYKVK